MAAEHKEEVVISGVAGMFPECDNVDELKDLLFNKVNGVNIDLGKRTSNQQMDIGWIGQMKNVDRFDATFFSAHQKLAEYMDPITRLCLERSVEAIVDAGVNPAELSATETAVFTGSTVSETESFLMNEFNTSQYSMIGLSKTMQANRLSYALNLTGPSFNMDGGWLCGSYGLEKAKEMIENGTIPAAIVTVTGVTLRPDLQYQFLGLNRLNRNDRTKPFSHDADGYNRSDVCVAFFLQKASEAKRSYGTLLSVKSAQFGDYGGQITEHAGAQFKSLLLDCYEEADVDPASVEFVEAYGSGIECEDSMELNVMEEVFCKENRRAPLKVGSVKSNVGHGEVGGLFASLVKAIIALDGGCIPPNINYAGPNENVPALKSGKIQVVTEKTPLVGDIIGVSAFGLNNAFSHVVLKRNKKVKTIVTSDVGKNDFIPRLITVSGRTEENVKKSLEKILSNGNDAEYVALVNNVFGGNIKAHYYRSFSVFPKLESRTDDVSSVDLKKRPVWFVFSGMGSQWQGMGGQLMRIPVFAEAIGKCDRVLAPLGVDIRHVLTSQNPKLFDNILNAFVGIAAVQIGLVDVLRAMDVEPDGIVGHSVGELGCAYADGCLTAEQMILSAYVRGRASLETQFIPGMMAAVGLGYGQIEGRLPRDVDVACRNSASSCTVSGPVDSVNAFVEQLKSDGIFAKAVNVAGIAYHSRYIQSAGPTLLKYLKQVIREPKPRSSKWISSSLPEARWHSELARYSSAEYHTNNLLSSVLFEDAIKHVPQDAIAIEIAPHGLLQAILKNALPETVTNVPLTKRVFGDSVRFLLNAIGKMYLCGMNPKVQGIYPRITLPVGRGTPSIHSLPLWDHTKQWTPLINSLTDYIKNCCERSSAISLKDNVHLSEYRVHGHHVLPLSYVLVDVWKIFIQTNDKTFSEEPVEFHNLRFQNDVTIDPKNDTSSYLMVQRGSGVFEYTVGDRVVFSGQISLSFETNSKTETPPPPKTPAETSDDCHESIGRSEIYSALERNGLVLGESFKNIAGCDVYGNDNFRGRVRRTGNDWICFVDGLLKFPLLVDLGTSRQLEAPVSVRHMSVSPKRFEETAERRDVLVDYNKVTGDVTCDGMKISDVKYGPVALSKQESLPIKLEERRFVRFDKSKCKDIREFVHDAMEVIMESDRRGLDNNTGKLVMCSPYHYDDPVTRGCAKAIRQIMDTQQIGTSETLSWDNVKNVTEYDESGRFITVTRSDYLQDTVRALTNKTCSYAIVSSCSKQNLQMPKDWKIITRQRCDDDDDDGGVCLALIKKRVSSDAKNVFIAPTDDSSYNASVWKALDNRSDGKIYIVSNSETLERVDDTLKMFKSPRLRFLFILDSNAPELKSNESFYTDQLSIDLTVNIYKQGGWGYYSRNALRYLNEMPEKITDAAAAAVPLFENLPTTNNYGNELAIKYLGLNFDDVVVEDDTENELGHLEYSGVVGGNDGENVMGIASFGRTDSKLRCDPVLSWPVPSAWTLEDAATVPLSYALAYYALNVLTTPLQTFHSVLVTSALHPVGRAAIAISLAEKCKTLIAVVDSRQQADRLSDMFPELPRSRILLNGNNGFDVPVKMITNGKGVDIVFNLTSGDAFQAALHVLATGGKFFHFTKSAMKNHGNMGLRVFLKNIAFSVVSANLLLAETERTKDVVRRALSDGLKAGVVNPFHGHAVVKKSSSANVQTMFDAMRSASAAELRKVVLDLNDGGDLDGRRKKFVGETYRCRGDRVYVVIGDKSNWSELVEWLVERGARQIVIAVNRCLMSSIASKKFNRIVSRNVSLRLDSDSNFETKEKTLDWLDRVSSSNAVLGSLFIVDRIDVSKLQNLRFAFEKHPHKTETTTFVCLSNGDGPRICAELKSNGHNALSVSWDGGQSSASSRPKNAAKILTSLDALLRNPNALDSSSFVCSTTDSVKVERRHRFHDTVMNYFPGSADELQLLNDKITAAEAGFVEVDTKSPRLSQLTKPVAPAFVVPGFKPHLVRALYERFSCPVFEARLPERFDSVDRLSEILVEKLESVADHGYVSLIGESWGGVVVLKMAQLLEARGTMVTVTLLEGDPDVSVGLAESFFANTNGIVDRLNALYRSFSDEIYDEQKTSRNTSSSRQQSIGTVALRVLDVIRHRLRAALESEPSPNKLLTKVSSLRHERSSGLDLTRLNDYCVEPPSVYVVPDRDDKHAAAAAAAGAETMDVIANNLSHIYPTGVKCSLDVKYKNYFFFVEN